MFQFPLHRDPRCNSLAFIPTEDFLCFSSLYIGILAATLPGQKAKCEVFGFSSLYIGILAATFLHEFNLPQESRFSSLYIGILAATVFFSEISWPLIVSVPFTSGSSLQLFQGDIFPAVDFQFQFPLHRDPRCNITQVVLPAHIATVSVPFTSGSSLQRNLSPSHSGGTSVSVPFTSGSSLQRYSMSG